jgi:ubiquinone/menaquinone biosynthesis C-methylase UbiE
VTTPDTAWKTQRNLWDREYNELQVIPSSTRTLASKALVAAAHRLRLHPGCTVLDIGCGNGRNSVYLAQRGANVHALDFSTTALDRLQTLASSTRVSDSVHAYCASLVDRLPFRDGSFPVVIDSYVFCHFLAEGLKDHYLNELRRVAKPGGLVFLSLFPPEDGYYQTMIGRRGPDGIIVTDPNNGIAKQLYTPGELATVLRRGFGLEWTLSLEFDDVVLGRCYRRRILSAIFRR